MQIKLIIGLGNSSPQYQTTYHNIGHIAAERLKLKIKNLKFKILNTNTYMNESGQFVKGALKKYRVKPGGLLIVHDDADIELGKYKFSFGRNSAGHNGVQNIIDQLKTKNFWRLRIGIRPQKNKEKADKLVLKTVSPSHKKLIASALKSAEKRLVRL